MSENEDGHEPGQQPAPEQPFQLRIPVWPEDEPTAPPPEDRGQGPPPENPPKTTEGILDYLHLSGEGVSGDQGNHNGGYSYSPGSPTFGGAGGYGGQTAYPPGYGPISAGGDGQGGSFGYSMPTFVYYLMESWLKGEPNLAAYVKTVQGRTKLTHSNKFLDSNEAQTTLDTEHEAAALAAINPDLKHMHDKSYLMLHRQKGKVSGGNNTDTITFKTLAAWAAWAKTDPMCTGNMHYTALVYPGCGEQVTHNNGQVECMGAGDCDLRLCQWMKPGPNGGASGNPKYEDDPGKDALLKVAVNDCWNKDDVAQMCASPGDYKRNCGADATSPLVAGMQFKARFDIKDELEALAKIACWFDRLSRGHLFSGVGAIEFFADHENIPVSANPYYGCVGIADNRTSGDVGDRVRKRAEDSKLFHYHSVPRPRVIVTPNRLSGLAGAAIGGSGKLTLAEYMTTAKYWNGGHPTPLVPRLGMAFLFYKTPAIDCNDPRDHWGKAIKPEGSATFKIFDAVLEEYSLAEKFLGTMPNCPEGKDLGTGKKSFASWKNAILKFLKKQRTAIKRKKIKVSSDYPKKIEAWNEAIEALAAKLETTPDPGLLKDEEVGTIQDYSAVHLKQKLIRVMEQRGAIPRVGYIMSDIPGTKVMGITFSPRDAEADGAQISNPDAICYSKQGSSNDGWPNTSPITSEYMTTHGCAPGKDMHGSTSDQPGCPSFLSQDGGGYPICETYGQGENCGTAGDGGYQVWPSYAPASPYDPLQGTGGLANPGFGAPLIPDADGQAWGSGIYELGLPSGIRTSDGTLRVTNKAYHGNAINGNDVRVIENCIFEPCRGAAINTCVKQRSPGPALSGHIPRGKGRNYTQRTMTLVLKNNVIVHKFAPPAYPVESGIYPAPGRNTVTGNGVVGGYEWKISTDVSAEAIVGNTLGGTYVQSTRTLTASGSWGLNLPSWVKRNSKVIFHHPHACSGIEYKIDKRIGASGILLSAASNPGSDVGPGAMFELRPKLYQGPIQKNYYANRIGYSPSVISVKNQAWNGAQLEVWMQNNTIMAHPDSCLQEDSTPTGALRRGHDIDSVSAFTKGSMATSGYLKSFAPKYISVANITHARPLITNPSGTYDKMAADFGPRGANTGWTFSHLNINMENNLICPVYNARLPAGKDYADEETSSSPKWDVVADIGLPVVNANSSGCVISHCRISDNVIVGRTVFDTTQKKYVQHSKDGNNILAHLSQNNNSGHPEQIPSGNLGYRWTFASGFSVYPGGPDDVFRSFYGPFYRDNLSDENASVTGKGDEFDSFNKQKSGFLQYALNDGVLYKKSRPPSLIESTFVRIPGHIVGLPIASDYDFDINGNRIGGNATNDPNFNLGKKLPPGVLEDKRAPKNSSEEDLVLSFGEKAILEHPPKSVSGESPRDLKSTRNLSRPNSRSLTTNCHYVGAVRPLPQRYDAKTRTHQSEIGKKRRSIRRSPENNPGFFGTVGQKQANLSSSGTYVNIDNSIPLHFLAKEPIPETITGGKTSDVIDYPNEYMPATEGGGIRVASGGKNDKPIIGKDDHGNFEIHLGQSRGHVKDNDKASENIDRLFDRFKTEGDGTQYGE